MALFFINQNPVMESVLRIARTPRLTARVVGTRIGVTIGIGICAGTSAPMDTSPAPVGVPHGHGSVMITVAQNKMITVIMMNTALVLPVQMAQ